jgi:hypothetical protein
MPFTHIIKCGVKSKRLVLQYSTLKAVKFSYYYYVLTMLGHMKVLFFAGLVLSSSVACNYSNNSLCECGKQKVDAYKELKTSEEICTFMMDFENRFPDCYPDGDMFHYKGADRCPEVSEQLVDIWLNLPFVEEERCEELLEQ